MISNKLEHTHKYSKIENKSENPTDLSIVFSADSVSYTSKPPKDKFGYLSNRVRDGYRSNSTIKELAFDYVAKGKSVSPARFIGERGKEGFLGAQSIWLDFDSKTKIITPAEVYDRLDGYGIKPNIFYHTFSHCTQLPKFRYVIAVDRFIRNGNAYRYILDGLNMIFTSDDGFEYLDQNCINDISRIYHGTNADCFHDYPANMTYALPGNRSGSEIKEVIYYGPQPTRYDDLKLLIDALNTKPFDRNRNGFRKVTDFDIDLNTHCIFADAAGNPFDDETIKVLLNRKKRNQSDPSVTNLTHNRKPYYIYNRTCGDASLRPDTAVSDFSAGSQIVKIKTLRSVCFFRLRETLKVVDDFVRGRMLIGGEYIEKNFDYNTLKLFAIAFLRIEGGIKWVTEVMKKHRENGLNYREEDFALLQNLQHKRYRNSYLNPNLKSFSPYEEDYSYTSIYEAAKGRKKGSVEICHENLPVPISLNEGEKMLRDIFKNVINQKTRGTLDLISAAIGLGKTRLLIDEIDHSESGVIIAFVTHQLKKQFIEDLTKSGFSENIDFIVTPQVPTFEDNDHNRQLEYLFFHKEFKEAKKYIHSIYQKEKETGDAIKAKEYATQYTRFMDSLIYDRFEGTIITTHSMCHYFDFQKISPLHHTCIFDEDLYSGGLISTDYLLLDEIKSIAQSAAPCADAFKDLMCRKVGIHNNDINVSISAIQQHLKTHIIKNKGIWMKLLELTQSKAFAITEENQKGKTTYRLLYAKRIVLKPQMKYIVLSGTAPEDLYNFHGIKKRVHNSCKFIGQTGQLIQHTGRSFSQSSLSTTKNLPENPDQLPVITFLKHKHKFGNAVQDIHMYNSLGYNALEGKDVMVVGTPHMNPYALALLAIEAGLSVDIEDKTLLNKSFQVVEYNGLKFKIFTYVNETLKNLSNQLIESELQQTVGRARLLRHDATVHLFSNFPLWQAGEFVY